MRHEAMVQAAVRVRQMMEVRDERWWRRTAWALQEAAAWVKAGLWLEAAGAAGTAERCCVAALGRWAAVAVRRAVAGEFRLGLAAGEVGRT